MDQSPTTEELLSKIHDLQEGHAQLQQEMTEMRVSGAVEESHPRSQSVSPSRSRLQRGDSFDGTSVSSEKLSGPFRHSSPLQRESRRRVGGKDSSGNGGGVGPSAVNFTDRQYLNILQSMGQSVHIFDLSGRIIYWNRTAENLYGYTAEEALGQNEIAFLTDPQDFALANEIVHRVTKGESWMGHFPVKNKKGDRFLAMTTKTPFYDGDSTLSGIICMSSDSRTIQEMRVPMVNKKPPELDSSACGQSRIKAKAMLGLDPQQPLQVAIASKMSNLASKVSNKLRTRKKSEEYGAYRPSEKEYGHHSDNVLSDAALSDHREDTTSSGASTPRGDNPPSFAVSPHAASEEKIHGKFHRDYGDEPEGKSIQKLITNKAEAWIGKAGLTWPFKGNEREVPEASANRFPWPWIHNDQDNDAVVRTFYSGAKPESLMGETDRPVENEASGSWSSSCNVNSTGSASSCGSTSTSTVNKVEFEVDCLDYEILWEDLTIGEQIGQGSCGTVYHGLWYGSDVAVKIFSGHEYTDDVILSFKQEVSLMKRLRHPNILLFMGAVTSPERLCIVTEYLPRGSLFRILKRKTPKVDWRRRTHIALDIARGMNYLHRCNPPIVHRDLKSSNLLVDKNWTVKVGDFGLSRLKRETYLTTKTGKGTPQWMAPEVLRNEPSDEKSDVYSFGVVLWELCTEKIPWDSLNSIQVIAAVGFMNKRLEIPKEVDAEWSSIIESCWHSEAQSRPTFQQLLEQLKDMQRQSVIQFQASRATSSKDTAHNE